MHQMPRDHGFQVLLIGKFRTSSICPGCTKDRLQHPEQRVPSPRPDQRRKYPLVECHALLECINKPCQEYATNKCETASSGGKPTTRFWNGDAAAVLNFRHILHSLRQTLKKPERFRRGTALPPVKKTKKPARGAKRSASGSAQPRKKPCSAKSQQQS